MKILLITLLFIATITYSQTADEIISKHIDAIGGVQKINDLSSVNISGNISLANGHAKGTLDIIVVKPDKFRYELGIMGIKIIAVINGKEGWSVNPMENEMESMSPDEIEQMKNEMNVIGFFMNYKDKGYRAELLPDEKVNEKEAYVIKMTGKDSSINYFDKGSYLLVRKTTWEKGQDNLFAVDTYISDFKNVDGIIFPGSSVSESDYKMLNKTLILDKISVNEKYADELFNKPEMKK